MSRLHISRRKLQVGLFATFLYSFLPKAMAIPREIPESKSLKNEIAMALQKSEPLIVFVSLDNCPFCKIAKENYLLPLMLEQKKPIVQINLRHTTPLLDWSDKPTTQDQLARFWSVKVAPTILFLGKDGREIAPRLSGGSNSDFYGAYLDERIKNARESISR